MDYVEYAIEINYPLRCKNYKYVYCLHDIIIFNDENAAKSSFIKNEINKKHVILCLEMMHSWSFLYNTIHSKNSNKTKCFDTFCINQKLRN